MRDLKLRALAAQNGVVLTPVELEGLARTEGQRNEGATSRGLQLALALVAPIPSEGRNPAVRAGEAERHQICVEMLHRPSLLARLPGLRFNQLASFSA